MPYPKKYSKAELAKMKDKKGAAKKAAPKKKGKK